MCNIDAQTVIKVWGKNGDDPVTAGADNTTATSYIIEIKINLDRFELKYPWSVDDTGIQSIHRSNSFTH